MDRDEPLELKQAKDFERVRQLHQAYLNCVFSADYYREVYSRTVRYAQHFDFAIGLGAAFSGGSGLGILADPKFAWLCAILTTASVILSIAKNTYNWPAKMDFTLRNIEFYGRAAGAFHALIEDLNYGRELTPELNRRYETMRDELSKAPADHYEKLPIDVQKVIQAKIRDRVAYLDWWTPNNQ